jgi:hypothetical protein
MATFDQLSPDQRAIVELVLRQGKTYAELAEMLNMPEPRVRELARDALVELAPVSVRGVEEDWRGQLADYVLGQQAGPEATATKGHLRRSEAARSWTRSLLDSLEQFYEDGGVPSIPDGERGRASRRPAREAAAGGAERSAAGGLAAAIDSAAAEVEELHGVPVDLVRTGDAPLDERVEALVRASREAMANAARHSGTDEISVFVDVGADELAVFVRDRGRGFDPEAAAAPGHGIEESIRGRMARADGTTAIDSSPEGTEVELRLRRRP